MGKIQQLVTALQKKVIQTKLSHPLLPEGPPLSYGLYETVFFINPVRIPPMSVLTKALCFSLCFATFSTCFYIFYFLSLFKITNKLKTQKGAGPKSSSGSFVSESRLAPELLICWKALQN